MFIFNKQIFPIICVCFLYDKNCYGVIGGSADHPALVKSPEVSEPKPLS